MLGMGVGLVTPIQHIAEVVGTLGEPNSVFLVFGPILIGGVLGCWGVFGATLAPIANGGLLVPPTVAVYGHYKTGTPLAPPLVMLAARTVHLYLA